MTIVIRLDGRFDVKRRGKLHLGLTRREFTSFISTAGIGLQEFNGVDDSCNTHEFGDVNGYWLFSTDNPDDHLQQS